MAIRTELSADKERGPGYGILKIEGFSSAEDPVDFSLMRNQGSEPYLGQTGLWQATETWHSAETIEATGGSLLIPVGPTIVNAIVNQSTTVAYRLTLASGTAKDAGTLRIVRPLLGSGAAAPEEHVPPPEPAPPPPPPIIEPAPPAPPIEPPAEQQVEEPEITSPEPPPSRSRWPLIVAVLAIVLIAGGTFAAWYTCLIAGFGAPRCPATSTASPEVPPDDETAAGTEPQPPENEAQTDVKFSCEGLDADDCFDVATTALEQREALIARERFQYAAEIGSLEANNALARMYDPATWARETSPVGKPDWETAVYWYERSARQGNLDGRLGAGRLLCEKGSLAFETKQGLQYLKEALEQDDEGSTRDLIKACESKVGG